jgi:hypothetical protein
MNARDTVPTGYRLGFFGALILIDLTRVGSGDDTTPAPDGNVQRADRAADESNLKAAEARVVAVAAQRASLASELVELMSYGRGETDPPNRANHLAARELAKLQEPAAIPFLVRYVDGEMSAYRSAGSGTYPEFPNVHALALYGRQSVPYIAQYVGQLPKLTDTQLDLYSFVLLGNFGYDEVGRQRAGDALATDAIDHPETVARLRSHLKVFRPPAPGR